MIQVTDNSVSNSALNSFVSNQKSYRSSITGPMQVIDESEDNTDTPDKSRDDLN